MNKAIIAAAALIAISASAFAEGSEGSSDGANGNSRPVFGQKSDRLYPGEQSWLKANSMSTNAAEIEGQNRMDVIPNYLNRSQLR